MPYLSIIVPVYNVAPYLNEALDSVLSRTFSDWECLCVDDGSKDSSPTILDDYARRAPRFKITHQPNAGVSAARNRALDQMHGTWLGFLDADDILSSDRLHAVEQIAQQHPETDWIRLWYQERFADNGDCVVPELEEPHCGVCTPQWGWKAIMYRSVMTLNYYRAKAVKDVRFNSSLTMGEDLVFELQLLPSLSNVVCDTHIGYFYRQLSNSAFHRPQTIEDYYLLLQATFNERIAQSSQMLNQIHQYIFSRVHKAILIWQRNHKRTSWRKQWPLRTLCVKAWKQGYLRPFSFGVKHKVRWWLFFLTGQPLCPGVPLRFLRKWKV